MNIDNAKLIAIALLYAMTFGLAGLEKWRALNTPQWFIDQFKTSLLGPFPKLISCAYWFIALFEALLAMGFLYSIFDNSLVKMFLSAALFLFVALGAGLRMASDYQGAANLFMYFGVTLVCLLAI